MQHEYRKIATIMAEQFDGSKEMRLRYHIYGDVIVDDFQVSPVTVMPVGFADPNAVNLIKKGDWIVQINDCYYPMDDDIFRKTYERVD